MEDTVVPAAAEGRDRPRPRGEVLTLRDGRGRRLYRYVAEELLVATEDVQRIAGALRDEGAEQVRAIHGMVVFRLPGGAPVPEVVARLRALEGAPVATPNHVMRPALHDFWGADEPPDAAEPLPELPHGDDLAGSGVTVGVLDTGLSQRDWFQGRARRARPGELDADRRDQTQDNVLDWEAGHGTHVTGIILQHAPGADVVVWNVNGGGNLDDVAANEAIVSLVHDYKVDMLNLSFGGPAADHPNEAMQRALRIACELNPDLVVVAAAGNRDKDDPPPPGQDDPKYVPATLEGVVAVGAVDADNNVAEYSCRGEWVTCSSRGDGIVSTFVDWKGLAFQEPPPDVHHAHERGGGHARRTEPRTFCGFARWSGTSFAAARVTGAIAAAASPPGRAKDNPRVAKERLLRTGGHPIDGGGIVINPRNFVVQDSSAGGPTGIEGVAQPVT